MENYTFGRLGGNCYCGKSSNGEEGPELCHLSCFIPALFAYVYPKLSAHRTSLFAAVLFLWGSGKQHGPSPALPGWQLPDSQGQGWREWNRIRRWSGEGRAGRREQEMGSRLQVAASAVSPMFSMAACPLPYQTSHSSLGQAGAKARAELALALN